MLLLLAGLVIRWGTRGRTARPARSSQVAAARTPARPLPSAPPWTGASDGDPSGKRPEAPIEDPLATIDDAARAWASVDMDAIRAAMPDNLYWKMAAPTKDPEALRAREEERARWNVEYGKVLSNTATDEEIDAYYAHQQQLSNDYLEFLVYLGNHYADVIPKRDVALLKLAGEMHLARLEEIPRKIAEAHERHAAHDAARRAWLEEQKAFETDPSDRQ